MAKAKDSPDAPAAVRARVLIDADVDGVQYRANDVVTLPADAVAAFGDPDAGAIAAALDVFGGREFVHADEVAKRAAAADQPKA